MYDILICHGSLSLKAPHNKATSTQAHQRADGPRGETKFPGIKRHAEELRTNRSHLFLVLTGQRKSASLIKRYQDLLKKEGRTLALNL